MLEHRYGVVVYGSKHGRAFRMASDREISEAAFLLVMATDRLNQAILPINDRRLGWMSSVLAELARHLHWTLARPLDFFGPQGPLMLRAVHPAFGSPNDVVFRIFDPSK